MKEHEIALAQLARLSRATEPHLVEMTAETLRRFLAQCEVDLQSPNVSRARKSMIEDVRLTIAAIAINQMR